MGYASLSGAVAERARSRAKSIRGVGSGAAGFVGVCVTGPVSGPPELVTSFDDFKRVFGGLESLCFQPEEVASPSSAQSSARRPRPRGTPNYLAHAVKSFFENGGQRLFVARIFRPRPFDRNGGVAESEPVFDAGPSACLRFCARFPGAQGNLPVRLRATRGPNALFNGKLAGLRSGDVVEVGSVLKPREVAQSPHDELGALGVVRFDELGTATLEDVQGMPIPLTSSLVVQRVGLTVEVGKPGGRVDSYHGLSAHPYSLSFIGTVLRRENPSDYGARVWLSDGGPGAAAIAPGDFDRFLRRLVQLGSVTLSGGNDGEIPVPADYWGGGAGGSAKGLSALAEVDEIALVAAPGSSALGDAEMQRGVRDELIAHCETERHRFAILSASDAVDDAALGAVRAQHGSSFAALYHPWIKVFDPWSPGGETLSLPPEGSVAGVCARISAERGAHAPVINEPLSEALSTSDTTSGKDPVLRRGVNLLQPLGDHGVGVSAELTLCREAQGASQRVKRLLIYLEHSIERGTPWVIFEPNNEACWQKVRLAVEGFLKNAWRSGALAGKKPEEAYFVHCDRWTMTAGDLASGRLVARIGVAPESPGRFVVFRLEKWTANAKIA